MAATQYPDDLIGGRYRLQAPIASGGMADVWRAHDTVLDREVAVKLLRSHVADDPVVAERFRREARALARLTHPNIVPVYDTIEEHGQVALIMRLIDGMSLRELLDKAGTPEQPGSLSVHLTVHIGRSIAAALAKAHAENLVHRDIKPGNILFTTNGTVLLTDFGIAKPLKASEQDDTDLTRAEIMMGTAKYLSPEQVQGRPLDGRADMYSLGLVLYECLAGQAPFKGENDQATAVARLERDPTPLQGLRADVPSTVVAVINKMLRRRPENRYQSCAEVADALEAALNQLHDAITPVEGVTPGYGNGTSRVSPPAFIDPLMPKKPERNLSVVPRVDNTPQNVSRERTPRGTARPKAPLPRTQRTSTKKNYIPIVLLLVAAAVMAGFLWKGLQNTRSSPSTAVVNNVEVGPVSVVGIKSYDPNGDDGVENESMIPFLTDNNPETSWTTVCYGNQYFGSKSGLGIVVQLSGVGLGTLTTTFKTAPWNAEVYVSTDEAIPTSIEGWGLRVADGFSQDPSVGTFEVKQPARNVLLLLREVGRSTTCSNNNPFKGVLSDLSFTSAS
jgi:serine/threonine protein kinase